MSRGRDRDRRQAPGHDRGKLARRRRMNAHGAMPGSGTGLRSAYFTEEHEMLRSQVRRFVEEEIKPHALAWEEQGFVPRDVLRRMGELGFLGIRYPEKYGGAGMDTPATLVLAEEPGPPTFAP